MKLKYPKTVITKNDELLEPDEFTRRLAQYQRHEPGS